MKFDIESLSEIILNRRSIYPKSFTGEAVDDKVIHRMLENANWAPTHALTEPWRFTVFTGEGVKKLALFQSELYKKVTEADGTFANAKYEKLSNNPLKCSHIVAIGMKREAREKIPEIEEIEAVACAVHNMHLTATAHGIGCYWGTGGVTYFEEAKNFFDLGEKDKLLGFLYIGVPAIDWPQGKRKPIAEKVKWITG